jgi:hypothetical protein
VVDDIFVLKDDGFIFLLLLTHVKKKTRNVANFRLDRNNTNDETPKKRIRQLMTLVGSLVAGIVDTWHVPEAARTKSRKKVLPNQLGRYYDNIRNILQKKNNNKAYWQRTEKQVFSNIQSIHPPPPPLS